MIQKYKKLFLAALVTVIVYIVLKYLLPLVLPFVLAYFICRLLYPAAEKLSNRLRLPLGLCAAVCVGLFSLVIIIAFVAGLGYLMSQVGRMSQGILQSEAWMSRMFDQLCESLSWLTGDSGAAVRALVCDWGERMTFWLDEKLPELAAGLVVPVTKGLGTAAVVVLVSLVGAVLLMKNKKRIARQLKQSVFAREITTLTGRICQVSAGFFKCQIIIIGIIAVILSAGLALMGNDYAVLIGITVAVLDALPVIGSGTVLLPWAFFSLLDKNFSDAAVLVILYVLCTVVRELLEPRLMGEKLGINEFYMLMATFTGLALFGVSGIFLGPAGMVMIIEILKQLEAA